MPQLVVGLITAIRLATSTWHPILTSPDPNKGHWSWLCLRLKTAIFGVLSVSDTMLDLTPPKFFYPYYVLASVGTTILSTTFTGQCPSKCFLYGVIDIYISMKGFSER